MKYQSSNSMLPRISCYGNICSLKFFGVGDRARLTVGEISENWVRLTFLFLCGWRGGGGGGGGGGNSNFVEPNIFRSLFC